MNQPAIEHSRLLERVLKLGLDLDGIVYNIKLSDIAEIVVTQLMAMKVEPPLTDKELKDLINTSADGCLDVEWWEPIANFAEEQITNIRPHW